VALAELDCSRPNGERQMPKHQSLIDKLQPKAGTATAALQVPPEQVSLRRRHASPCKPDQQGSRGGLQRTGLRDGVGFVVRVGDTDGDAAAVPEPDVEADGLGEGALELVTLPDGEREGLWSEKRTAGAAERTVWQRAPGSAHHWSQPLLEP